MPEVNLVEIEKFYVTDDATFVDHLIGQREDGEVEQISLAEAGVGGLFYDTNDDVELHPGVFPADGTAHGGVFREATSFQAKQYWTSSSTTAPVDPARGTFLRGDLNIVQNHSGAFGPQIQSGLWGPRALINLEGTVKYGVNQNLFSLGPVGIGLMYSMGNKSGQNRSLNPSWGFMGATFLNAQAGIVTVIGNDTNAGGCNFVDTPVWCTTDSGSIDGATNNAYMTSFLSQPAMWGNVHAKGRIGLDVEGVLIQDFGGTQMYYGLGAIDEPNVTIDEEIGVRIGTFTAGTKKIGVLSAHDIISETGFYGSQAANGVLVLGSTTHATRGTVNVRDRLFLMTENKAYTTVTPKSFIDIGVGRTITVADAVGPFYFGNNVNVISYAGTILYDENGGALGSGGFAINQAVYTNRNGEARSIGQIFSFVANPYMQADAALGTYQGLVGLLCTPTYQTINGGAITAANNIGVNAGVIVNSGATVTTHTAFIATEASGTGTLTTQIGLDVQAFSKGATNIGIRNGSSYVSTPRVNTAISGATATIRSDGELVTITASGSFTLTSNPTIAAGQNGQQLTILNVDTTDTITLQDANSFAGTTLRLSASTVALGPGDSIQLIYSTVSGRWHQIGQGNVV